jgi:hypothetical protein
VLTHEIKKPEEPRQRFRHVREVMMKIVGDRGPQQAKETVVHAGVSYMSKIGYAMWIEEEVRKRFPVMSFCTLRNAPFIPTKLPNIVFQIMDIQEVHWMAPINPNWNEPAALLVRNTQNNVVGNMCPNALRPLQNEEVILAHARNKAAQDKRDAEESKSADDFDEPDPVG